MMTAISSRRLYGLFRKSGPAGSFLKTLLDSSPFWSPWVFLKWKSRRLSYFARTVSSRQTVPSSVSSDASLEVSLRKLSQRDIFFPGSKTARQSFCVFQLAPSAPFTDVTGSGLLPTPMASETSSPTNVLMQFREGRELKDRKTERGTGGQVSLTEHLIYYTLMAAYGVPPVKGIVRMPPAMLETLRPLLPTQVEIERTGFPYGMAGQLNPRFAAWMMGFPADWTESAFDPGASSR